MCVTGSKEKESKEPPAAVQKKGGRTWTSFLVRATNSQVGGALGLIYFYLDCLVTNDDLLFRDAQLAESIVAKEQKVTSQGYYVFVVSWNDVAQVATTCCLSCASSALARCPHISEWLRQFYGQRRKTFDVTSKILAASTCRGDTRTQCTDWYHIII